MTILNVRIVIRGMVSLTPGCDKPCLEKFRMEIKENFHHRRTSREVRVVFFFGTETFLIKIYSFYSCNNNESNYSRLLCIKCCVYLHGWNDKVPVRLFAIDIRGKTESPYSVHLYFTKLLIATINIGTVINNAELWK